MRKKKREVCLSSVIGFAPVEMPLFVEIILQFDFLGLQQIIFEVYNHSLL